MATRSRIYASSVIYFFGAGFDFAVEAFEGVLRAAAEVEFLLVVLALFDVFFFATFGAGGGRGAVSECVCGEFAVCAQPQRVFDGAV